MQQQEQQQEEDQLDEQAHRYAPHERRWIPPYLRDSDYEEVCREMDHVQWIQDCFPEYTPQLPFESVDERESDYYDHLREAAFGKPEEPVIDDQVYEAFEPDEELLELLPKGVPEQLQPSEPSPEQQAENAAQLHRLVRSFPQAQVSPAATVMKWLTEQSIALPPGLICNKCGLSWKECRGLPLEYHDNRIPWYRAAWSWKSIRHWDELMGDEPRNRQGSLKRGRSSDSGFRLCRDGGYDASTS